MDWLVWVFIAFVVITAIGGLSSSGSKKSSSKAKPARDVEAEAREIADKVTTIHQFRALEKRKESTENRAFEFKTERAMEAAEHKREVLEKAVWIAQAKHYQHQFVPEIDLDTPKEVLDRAYKVVENEELQELKKCEAFDVSDWCGIDGWGEKLEPDPALRALKKFRTIVESRVPREKQAKRITQLVSKNEELEQFLSPDGDLAAGDQYFAEKLREDGLPLAVQLYSEGYTTPEKCLSIKPNEFRQRKGVGPKQLEKLLKYQLKVKQEHNRRKQLKKDANQNL